MKKDSPKSPFTPSDLGTRNLSHHYQLQVELAGQQNVRPRIRVLDQRILDRLRVRKLITEDKFQAGERLYALAYKAGISSSILSNIHAAVRVRASNASYEFHQTEARDRVRKALGYIQQALGVDAASILVAVTVNDLPLYLWASGRGIARSKAMPLLSTSLGELYRYWLDEASLGRVQTAVWKNPPQGGRQVVHRTPE